MTRMPACGYNLAGASIIEVTLMTRQSDPSGAMSGAASADAASSLAAASPASPAVMSLIEFTDGLSVEARTEAWLAHEARLKASLPGAGVVDRATLSSRTGLDMIQGMADGRTPRAPIGDVVDMVPVEASVGRMVFQGRPSRRFYNPIGTVHGGWIATLLDSAVGCAVHTTLSPGQGYTTLELKVNYLRAVTDRTGPLRAEGRVLHVSRQIGLADGRLYDAAGKVYAHATTTCLIFPLPAAAG